MDDNRSNNFPGYYKHNKRHYNQNKPKNGGRQRQPQPNYRHFNGYRSRQYMKPGQQHFSNRNDNNYCHNCGRMGHTGRKCLLPVMSYGIILFYPYKVSNLIQSDCFRTRLRQHLTLNTEASELDDNEDFQVDINNLLSTSPPNESATDKVLVDSKRLPPGLVVPVKDIFFQMEASDNSEEDIDDVDDVNDKNIDDVSEFPTNLDVLCQIPERLETKLNQLIQDDMTKPDYKYLMIQDRHTPDYGQLIWGNYDFEHLDYLKTLVSRLTKTEIRLIETHSLTKLFVKYWIFSKKDALRLYKKQYLHSKKLFTMLKSGTTNSKGEFIQFSQLVQEVNPDWTEPDWGFPKGRRKRHQYETDLDCAMREFKEETGIDQSQYTILRKVKPVEEILQGSNGITYKHVYYLAEAKNYLPIYLNPYNSLQVSEIRKIGWYSYDQGIRMIRNYHSEKKSLFRKINHYLEQ